MKAFYITLAVLFSLISCNSKSTQVLLDDDLELNRNQTVSLLIIEAEPLFNKFPNYTFGALRPTEQKIFNSDLARIVSEQTQSPFIGKKNLERMDTESFEIKNFETKSVSFEMISPKSGTMVNDENIESRFTLILDQFYFTPYEVQTGGGSYAGHEGEPQTRIAFETTYLIWDNEQKKEVAYGKVNSSHILYQDDIEKSYREALASAFQKIIDVSPLIKNENV